MNLESACEYNENTVQLIGGMLSFLDDSTEDTQLEATDELKNPICWAIKRIINIQPKTASSENNYRTEMQEKSFYENRMNANQIEKACRYKDPYMAEVNRLMYSSTIGHPPNGSPEYFQAAENYALFGKEFLDFPTDIKFPQPMDVTCFGDPSSLSSPLINSQPPGFGMQMGKYAKQFSAAAPQQQMLVNQPNYCSYPVFPAHNIVPPLIYTNPFLMTQYLNTFVKETQINTSLVQQQQYNMSGGIHDRLVYAQMLQQQIQTNQALMSCCFVGNATNRVAKSTHEMLKIDPTCRSDGAEDISDLEQ